MKWRCCWLTDDTPCHILWLTVCKIDVDMCFSKGGTFYHSPQIRNISKHGCTNSGHLVVLSSKCCSLAPNVFQHKYCSLLLTRKNAYNFKCTWQKAPDKREVRRLLQNFGSSAWNLLHEARLAARIWKWLLIFLLENLWTPCWEGFCVFCL